MDAESQSKKPMATKFLKAKLVKEFIYKKTKGALSKLGKTKGNTVLSFFFYAKEEKNR